MIDTTRQKILPQHDHDMDDVDIPPWLYVAVIAGAVAVALLVEFLRAIL